MPPAPRHVQSARTHHRRHRHGKTVTLQVIAERLSDIGVAVFMADVKGDLAA